MTDAETGTTTEPEFDPPTPFPTRAAAAAALDVVVVGVFALVGRINHAEPITLGGWWHTAWPFLAGLALGWVAATLATRGWPVRIRHGVPIWITTVLGGMVLRALTDQGTAASFIVVATVFLGATLIGWRVVVWLVLDRGSAGSRA